MSKKSSTLEKVLHISACFIVEIDAGKITLDDALDKCDPMIRRITEHLLLSFYRNRKKILALLNKFCSKTPPPYTGALLSSALTQIIFQNFFQRVDKMGNIDYTLYYMYLDADCQE